MGGWVRERALWVGGWVGKGEGGVGGWVGVGQQDMRMKAVGGEGEDRNAGQGGGQPTQQDGHPYACRLWASCGHAAD